METHVVALTQDEFDRLEREIPRSDKPSQIGRRAEAIVKIYWLRLEPLCRFAVPRSGADLEVTLSESCSRLFEIKGTTAVNIAMQQLKVSSDHSRRLIEGGGVDVLRVTNVFAKDPVIYEMRHGVDFTLVPEGRWAFKSVGAGRQSLLAEHPVSEVASVTRIESSRSSGRKSKYEGLRDYLQRQTGDSVTLHFSDAERLLGFKLPPSTSSYPAFWANQVDVSNRPWAKAWQEAGYVVHSHQLSGTDGWVRFRRS